MKTHHLFLLFFVLVVASCSFISFVHADTTITLDPTTTYTQGPVSVTFFTDSLDDVRWCAYDPNGSYGDCENFDVSDVLSYMPDPTIRGVYDVVGFDFTTDPTGCGSGVDLATCQVSSGFISDNFFTSADPPPPPPPAATSSIEQSQQNLSTAFYLFFLSFFGTMWLLRRTRA